MFVLAGCGACTRWLSLAGCGACTVWLSLAAAVASSLVRMPNAPPKQPAPPTITWHK